MDVKSNQFHIIEPDLTNFAPIEPDLTNVSFKHVKMKPYFRLNM